MEIIKKILRPPYYLYRKVSIALTGLWHPSKIKHASQIPIIINNRNRLTFMLQLIARLEEKGYSNIFIIDNNSSYPPLLEYYRTCKYKVFRLEKNIGFLALWRTPIYKQFIKDYYVYTDSDVVPVEECPADFMSLFWQTLKSDRSVYKVGFSLKIDDLPEHFGQREAVIKWEKSYFERQVSDKFYEANIDTTFAMYRPGMSGGASYLKSYRSVAPYTARHMPWYLDDNNLSQEDIYYIEHAKTSTHWTKQLNR